MSSVVVVVAVVVAAAGLYFPQVGRLLSLAAAVAVVALHGLRPLPVVAAAAGASGIPPAGAGELAIDWQQRRPPLQQPPPQLPEQQRAGDVDWMGHPGALWAAEGAAARP